MTLTLHTHKGPIELEDRKILCNNGILPEEYNPHKVRLWIIGHVFGAVVAVWADCEQDALDEVVDAGKGDWMLCEHNDSEIDPELDEQGYYAHLGNAGEYADLSDVWIEPVMFDPARDWKLLCMFAEARGMASDSLWF